MIVANRSRRKKATSVRSKRLGLFDREILALFRRIYCSSRHGSPLARTWRLASPGHYAPRVSSKLKLYPIPDACARNRFIPLFSCSTNNGLRKKKTQVPIKSNDVLLAGKNLVSWGARFGGFAAHNSCESLSHAPTDDDLHGLKML